MPEAQGAFEEDRDTYPCEEDEEFFKARPNTEEMEEAIPVHTGEYCFYSSTEGLGCVQDTILVVPPYPYSIAEDTADVPWEDMWYARAQLFFTCHLRPSGGPQPKNPSYNIGPDDLLFNLVFFSTFEELDLPIHGQMEGAAVLKLYEPSLTPCLYVGPNDLDHVLGRVPLFPLFLAGNSTPTIPH